MMTLDRSSPVVLVLSDDIHLRELAQFGLTTYGYAVVSPPLDEVEDTVWADVLVIDARLSLPSVVPIVARSGDDPDVVRVVVRSDTSTEPLDGAVDEPFSIDDLAERIGQALGPRAPHAVLTVGDLRLDTASGQLCGTDGTVDLTPTEERLLRELMIAAPDYRSREQLLASVWGYGFTSNASVLETYVSYLRKKLPQVGTRVALRTIRSRGYGLHVER